MYGFTLSANSLPEHIGTIIERHRIGLCRTSIDLWVRWWRCNKVCCSSEWFDHDALWSDLYVVRRAILGAIKFTSMFGIYCSKHQVSGTWYCNLKGVRVFATIVRRKRSSSPVRSYTYSSDDCALKWTSRAKFTFCTTDKIQSATVV